MILYLVTMMKSVIQYAKLVYTIISHGRFFPLGENFNQLRREKLVELQSFIPLSYLHANRVYKKTNYPKLQFLLGQAAFIKNCFLSTGGHLSAYPISYIRIPKAASTSASMMMLETIYPTLKQKTLSDEQINFLADVNMRSVTDNKDHIFFTIVRNPFARLVSVYHDFIENANENFIYSDYLFGIIPPRISFDDFVDCLTNIPDRLQDQHLKPQHYFIDSYRSKKIEVSCFKLEEQESLNSFLNQHSLHLQHKNKSPHAYQFEKYYSPTSLKKAYHLYQSDIEQFNYHQEFESLSKAVMMANHSQKTVQK